MKSQISALMDDELDAEGAAHLITAAKAGGELSKCWSTYHLIGDVMRGDSVFNHGFKDRVMAKLAAEPSALEVVSQLNSESVTNELVSVQITEIGAKLSTKNHRLIPRASSPAWSVAASVAAVMFVGWMVMQQQTQSGSDVSPMQMAQTNQTLAPVEIAQSMPNEYLLAHQASAPNSVAYYIQPAAYSETK